LSLYSRIKLTDIDNAHRPTALLASHLVHSIDHSSFFVTSLLTLTLTGAYTV